jgi:hypothetical protein
MLGLPETGFADPETGADIDAFQLADWLEGCVTFVDDSLSQNDIVDTLHENYLAEKTDAYSAKSDAAFRVAEAWGELRRRLRCLGKSAPYSIDGLRLKRVNDWQNTPAYAFCLLAALRPSYRAAFAGLNDYSQQGGLFEHLTIASLQALGWSVHGVGWSKTAADSIASKVEDVARFLAVDSLDGSGGKWTTPKAKDAGLDAVCQYVFPDGWSGRPTVLTQCASGENWEEKLHTPDVNTWGQLVRFITRPTRGLSMPFVINPDRFRRAAVRDGVSLLLDRHRLMVPHKEPLEWLPPKLVADLVNWVKDHLVRLEATVA